jgi:ribA/ribD-fused uncharacterized protein
MINKFEDTYEWLSNFYWCDIEFNGRIYPSVEHAFMSAKSNDSHWKRICRDKTIYPGKIKKKSRDIALVKNWDNIKVHVIEECLTQKFNKEPFKTLLINTGDQHICEGNTWKDKFWGVDAVTGEGENMLGEIIMNIRSQLVKGNS